MQLRWPWVSREAYEAMTAELEVARAYHDRWEERTVAELRRLTDLIVEMKREGFHPAPAPDAMPSPEPDLPSQITEAIMARSTRKSDLERELYRYAIRAYNGQNAEDVAGTIWHGGDPQEDE